MSLLPICSRLTARSTTLALALVMSTSGAMAQTAKASTAPAPVTTAATSAAPQILARGPADVVITNIDVMADLQRAPEATRKAILASPESIQQLVSNLLVRRTLAHEAQRDGLAQAPLVAASLALSQDRVLSDARLTKLDTQNEPSAMALQAYAQNFYQTNADKFVTPAQTRASHILITNLGPESLVKAKDLLAQLRAGASFEALAKANSNDPGSAARGGDLGFFSEGQMVRPFEDAVTKLAKPGDLSEPIESQFGYHIIRLEARREKGRLSFDEVKPQLLAEARTALLNESRVQKVASMNQEFIFEANTIKALSETASIPTEK